MLAMIEDLQLLYFLSYFSNVLSILQVLNTAPCQAVFKMDGATVYKKSMNIEDVCSEVLSAFLAEDFRVLANFGPVLRVLVPEMAQGKK